MAAVAADPARHLPAQRVLRPVLALIVLGAAGFLWWQARASEVPGGVIVASGTIEAEETNVALEVAGRIVELPVVEGDAVARGATLIRLDDSVGRAQIAQARAATDVARANLALVGAGARAEEVRAAEAGLAQASAARAAAERALVNARLLRDNPQELALKISQAEVAVAAALARLDQVVAGPRDAELAAARAAFQQALEGADAAHSRLNLLRQGARPEDVRSAELALDQARNTLWAQQTSRDGVCGNPTNPRYLCDAAKAQVAAAETSVQSAANALQRVRNGPLPEEIRVAETLLTQAQETVPAAAMKVRDLEAGATSPELALAYAGIEQAQRQLADLLSIRDQPVAANVQVDAALGQVEQARAAEAAANAKLDGVNAGASAEQLAVARAGVAQAEAALSVLEAQATRLTVTAPIDGTVTRLSARLGEAVVPGPPLLTLAPLDLLRLNVYVPEDRIGLVRLGQPVAVRVDSFPGEQFTGSVSYIAAKAEFTPRNVQTQADRAKTVFAVRVRLPNADGRLKPGMYADATLRP
ncbi:MAG: efflux RND transporter periplasmic adaptor subunit [Chloroflexi bacterium]|nr:efflux RND transporter periplasmic adaptor subunit [Chloroflexota bacterium]